VEERIPLITPVIDDGHLEDISSTKAPKSLRKASPKRVTGKKLGRGGKATTTSFAPGKQRICPVVFSFSIGGTTQAAAKAIVEDLKSWQRKLSSEEADNIQDPIHHDLTEVEYDDFFITAPKDENVAYFYMFVIPTYNIDTVLDNFMEHLQETHNDFRIDTAPLFGILGYSVFGFGDKQDWPTEEEGFCSQAKEVDKWMAKLTGRKRAFPLGMGDVRSDSKERLEEWKAGIQEALVDIMSGNGLGEGVAGSGDPVESDEEDVEEEQPKSSLGDVEDLGRSYRNGTGAESGPLAIDFTTYGKSTKMLEPAPLKEMVPKTSPTYTALTKQGYTIVGSHSGVKICRWTKSALRGRGSCYKYSFYGIKSHLCMETTPSLSCSNKCVFCWRHGTNPVGTTWRWKVDPPGEIFDGVKAGHYKKIKMMKGVPGVRAERFAEAMQIKHCALSLVGEPIFYPHINEFVGMLHAERISSFLVCNAQHPDQLAALGHVTQLYVSIDASNKESLRKIDRPLHRDFWERFQRCLDILREKRFMQRTVFRLTLVKGFNIDDEVEGYADLVEKGLPCFVEVKGVTYCGTSTSSSAGLSMQNVPFYSEVSAFVVALNDALAKRGLEYGIAAEHAHSCCVLLASTRFKKEGKWHTRIDYDKFFVCLESGEEFGPDDYVGDETPEWALWGNGGFDPRDERVDRKGRPKVVEKDLRGLVEI
jgi:tRNA wybutosine-synthesizing protein 1